ncbi:hypothetical protein PR048_008217 [Dryococelus australis]|uniref:HTH psq-type domain-containing protein n=1 Tax=Dryococelus australis TaxID=614101 RepID=A0ABQ9HWK4_9NEOP|nr:hypothetical protein PR048_008217 [Dryococelus australis]
MAAKQVKKSFFKYSENDLRDAIKFGSERKYNVPHSTLINKLKDKVPFDRKMGPDTILTPQEEILCRWIIANAKKGTL